MAQGPAGARVVMNQGIAFSRTIRALEADNFRASKFGLMIAVALLAAWIWWMLAARVPQYETITNVRIESGRAIAYFSGEAASHIQAGQQAMLHFGDVALPARVQTVTSGSVELLVATPSRIPASTSVTAEVEVSRTSPAAIALRTLR
jgi:hypothetical protein